MGNCNCLIKESKSGNMVFNKEYVIQYQLGAGQTSFVYLAKKMTLPDRIVAIKIINKQTKYNTGLNVKNEMILHNEL